MVAKAMSLEYGIAGVCVLLTLMILIRVAEFVWKLHQKKEAVSEETMRQLVDEVRKNTVAVQLLEHRLHTIETSFSELPKLKLDLRRSFSAIKTLAGNRWASIREDLMKDRLAQ